MIHSEKEYKEAVERIGQEKQRLARQKAELKAMGLFAPDLVIGNQRVRATSVPNFDGVNPKDNNICFTTIQKLHVDHL